MTDLSRFHECEGIAKGSTTSYYSGVQDYRRLTMWQRSRTLTAEIYRLTAVFPSDEQYGLVAQMRRAAVSISSNIAEGCGRDTPRELSRFVSMAAGSAHELESQIYLSMDLRLADASSAEHALGKTAEVKAMLFAFRRTLRNGNTSRI